jgi:hypothetical protein
MKRFDMAFIISFIIALFLLGFAAYEAFVINPLIDPELGDLKLFVFIFAGTIAGFTVGYYWRRLTAKKQGGRQLVG